ncbi:hypothetical protein D3C71_1043140 [compost metagenome]
MPVVAGQEVQCVDERSIYLVTRPPLNVVNWHMHDEAPTPTHGTPDKEAITKLNCSGYE